MILGWWSYMRIYQDQIGMIWWGSNCRKPVPCIGDLDQPIDRKSQDVKIQNIMNLRNYSFFCTAGDLAVIIVNSKEHDPVSIKHWCGCWPQNSSKTFFSTLQVAVITRPIWDNFPLLNQKFSFFQSFAYKFSALMFVGHYHRHLGLLQRLPYI